MNLSADPRFAPVQSEASDPTRINTRGQCYSTHQTPTTAFTSRRGGWDSDNLLAMFVGQIDARLIPLILTADRIARADLGTTRLALAAWGGVNRGAVTRAGTA